MSVSSQQIVKNFAPSWFAAVMGTGVLALGAAFLGHQFSPLAPVAVALHWFNVALLLWGFGAWWLCMAAMLTYSYWKRGQLPFALSWWAFTFPTGAFAVASFKLAGVLPLPGIFGLGLVAYGLLAMFWSVTLVRSVRGALDGSLFQPH